MSEIQNKYKNNGISALDDCEILQLLLEFTTSPEDAKIQSNQLFEKFGSLSCIFERTPRALIDAGKINEQSAVLLNMQSALLRLCEKEKNFTHQITDNNYLSIIATLFIGATTEQFYLLCLNKANKILSVNLLSEGTLSRVNIYTRTVLEIALHNNADKIILTHNHPNGIPFPSTEDISLTHILTDAVEALGIQLLDHVIVTNKSTLSMRNDLNIFDSRLQSKLNTKFITKQ